jgi:hypothetical protein
MRRRLIGLLTALVAVGALLAPAARAGVLPIPPIVQQTQVWCWVAVGEMVFRYFGIANVNPYGVYQCGIIGALAADQSGMSHPCASDCTQCIVPAGTEGWVRAMLERYPAVVQAFAGSAQQLGARHEDRALDPEALAGEIDDGLPVIAGITPYGIPLGISAHVALIVGYHRDDGGALWLKVNDPYPYAWTGADPYVAAGGRQDEAGGYWIGYDDFTARLQWTESFRIRRR